MDQFSTIILMIIAFLAWNQNIPVMFIGLIIVLVLTSKSVGLSALFIAGAVLTYYIGVKEVWLAVAAIMAAAVILAKRKEQDAASMYSPELMRLLGGGGGVE